MTKELNISKCRALTRIFVLVSGLLFLSPEVFAFIDSFESGDEDRLQYIYDERNQKRAHIQHKADGNLTTLYDYDAVGNLAQQQDAKGQVFAYEYDALNRLHIQNFPAGGDITSIVTTYDANGNLDVVTENKPGSVVEITDHNYDLLDRLESKNQRGHIVSYTYDNNGNSTAKTDTTGEGPASTLFTYNSRNQLVGVAAGNTGSEVGKGAYHYNYQGMRIRHLGSARGDIEYVYDDKSIIDELGNGSTTQVAHYSYGDRLLSLTSGSAEQFYHYAALGTTANLTNTSGQNQIAYRLDPFGEITQQEGTSLNRQVFTGHEHDTETGLIYMKARFYDPAVGRFINQDTYLGESTTPPSLHRYLYAYGNPLVYVDPDGHSPLMMDPGMQRAMLELIPDQRMKDVAVQHWEFEQRATAPMAAGIAVQTGSDLLSGAMDTAEYINNVMYSPISSRHRAKAAETTSGFIEGIDQLISSRGMTVVDGLLASHNRAVESVEQEEFYRAGKESASIAQMQLSVATVGLSAPLAAKSGVDVLKAGVRTSKAKTSASVTSEANVGPLDSAVDVVGQGDRFVPDNIRYEKYWDDLGQTPASLSNRETRAWYLSKEMEIPGLLDTSKSLEYQAKQAFEIRNDLRAGARDLMADQKAADYLRMNEPNLTWEELVTIKSVKYSGDDLWNSIISSSQKSRGSVNTQFNFIGDRPRYD